MPILQRFLNNGTGYVYTNTRVRVMKSKLLTKDDFEKIIKMSVAEVARFLQEREYKKEFDELGGTLSGANLIEYSLNRNLENQFSSILRFSVRGAKHELTLYLKRFDIMNIKTILRGKLSGISNGAIINELIVAGGLSKNFFRELVERSKSFDDCVEGLKSTEYYSVLKKNQSNPVLEDELDRFYYESLLKGVSKNSVEFIKHEITSKNIAVEARAKKYKLTFKPLKGGRKVDSGEFTDSPVLRSRLRREFIQRALKVVSKFSHNITPVIAYFIAKENEASNIRIAIRGKKAGLQEDVIRQQLILGE